MNNTLKIISVVFIVLIFLNGCTSQISQKFGQDFDLIKAAKTRVSLGLTYLKNGNFSQAKFNLNKALEFAPRSADANFAMAYYYQNVGELEQAENTYQFAMDLAPTNANIANSYGAFLCQNGDYAKAKIYFLKAVNTSNYISSAETYENLALCSRSQGQPEDAIHYLRSAVNHQPGRANSLFLLARSLVETHQWQEARSILRRYEKIAQINPQSLLMAIKIAQGTGNNTAAKGYSDMLLNMYPNDPVTKTWLTNTQPSGKILDNSSETLSNNTLPLPAKIVVLRSEKNANTNIDNIVLAKQDLLDTPIFHIVAKGDNLYRISLLYNIKMQRLIDWNSLVDSSAIFDGKKLSLVAPSVVE